MMIGLALTCAYPFPAHSFQFFSWTAGRLSDFLKQLGEMGVTVPLQEPWAIDITRANGHLVDVDLETESLVVGSGGVLSLDSGKSVNNRSTGVFSVQGLTHINVLAGAEVAPSFDNEGVFSIAAEHTAFVSVRFVNLNGGVVHAGEDSRLSLSNADIRNLSSFSGSGLVELAGHMAGEIESEQSLAVTGATIGDNAVLTGDWGMHDFAKLAGTWTNNGTLHGQPNLGNKLGTLDAGILFTNNGTIVGNGLRMVGNDLSADPEDATRLVNFGTLDLDGGGISTSGVAASHLVNHGVLQNNETSGGVLSDVRFENFGTLSAASGSTLSIQGADPGSPRRGSIFRSGTQFRGEGVVSLTGGPSAVHEFHGVAVSENLRLSGSSMDTSYHGNAAMLLGSTLWRSGQFTGGWTNGGTLTVERSALAGLRTRAIADSFVNLGTVDWNKNLVLRESATVLNLGLFTTDGGAGNLLEGTFGGALETFENAGRFVRSGANVTTVRYIDFRNHGILEVRDGTVRFLDATLSNTGTILGNGTLEIAASATLVNDGVIAPGLSPGKLIIKGDFTNGPAGIIEIEMASATIFDVLQISSGHAALGGTLRIKLLDGFMPNVGDSFDFLKYSSVSGEFARIQVEGHAGGEFDLLYDDFSFRLGFKALPAPVPLPPAWVLLASGLLTCARWRQRFVQG